MSYRLFRKNEYSINDLLTQRNLMICGVILGACTLAAYSFTAFFFAAALTATAVMYNECARNDNSVEGWFEKLFR